MGLCPGDQAGPGWFLYTRPGVGQRVLILRTPEETLECSVKVGLGDEVEVGAVLEGSVMGGLSHPSRYCLPGSTLAKRPQFPGLPL